MRVRSRRPRSTCTCHRSRSMRPGNSSASRSFRSRASSKAKRSSRESPADSSSRCSTRPDNSAVSTRESSGSKGPHSQWRFPGCTWSPRSTPPSCIGPAHMFLEEANGQARMCREATEWNRSVDTIHPQGSRRRILPCSDTHPGCNSQPAPLRTARKPSWTAARCSCRTPGSSKAVLVPRLRAIADIQRPPRRPSKLLGGTAPCSSVVSRFDLAVPGPASSRVYRHLL